MGTSFRKLKTQANLHELRNNFSVFCHGGKRNKLNQLFH